MATYADIATFKNSADSIDRISVAVINYARFLLADKTKTLAQVTLAQAQWARGAFQNPGGVASGLLFAVASDSNIQAQLPKPDDPTIQAATELAVNTVLNF